MMGPVHRLPAEVALHAVAGGLPSAVAIGRGHPGGL